MPQQYVERPAESDIQQLARQYNRAQVLIPPGDLGAPFDGGLDDLARLQRILDSGRLQADDTVALQCLGVPFGQVMVNENVGFDWWMVDDSQGRDPCLRYRETDLLIYPLTLISKRVEDGAEVDVAGLYRQLMEQLRQITPLLDAQTAACEHP